MAKRGGPPLPFRMTGVSLHANTVSRLSRTTSRASSRSTPEVDAVEPSDWRNRVHLTAVSAVRCTRFGLQWRIEGLPTTPRRRPAHSVAGDVENYVLQTCRYVCLVHGPAFARLAELPEAVKLARNTSVKSVLHEFVMLSSIPSENCVRVGRQFSKGSHSRDASTAVQFDCDAGSSGTVRAA